MLGRISGFVARSFARIFFCNDGLSCNCFCIRYVENAGLLLMYTSSVLLIECVHCHAIKNRSKKTMQWTKSKNCDIVDNK